MKNFSLQISFAITNLNLIIAVSPSYKTVVQDRPLT